MREPVLWVGEKRKTREHQDEGINAFCRLTPLILSDQELKRGGYSY